MVWAVSFACKVNDVDASFCVLQKQTFGDDIISRNLGGAGVSHEGVTIHVCN